jgi:hypothetical protein
MKYPAGRCTAAVRAERKRFRMQLPEDPILLLSVVNTQLRDHFPTLEALCADCGVEPAALCRRLEAAGYRYLPAYNQFR